MGQHAAISNTEGADRLAIRELIEAYAHCAIVATLKVRWRYLPQTPISWCT
jgi:hypothetical protein